MSKTKDGGPAFPTLNHPPGFGGPNYSGMSLLDYFAKDAMTAMLRELLVDGHWRLVADRLATTGDGSGWAALTPRMKGAAVGREIAACTAEWAYDQAEAMLAERERRATEKKT